MIQIRSSKIFQFYILRNTMLVFIINQILVLATLLEFIYGSFENDGYSKEDPCSLYLYHSSIPGAGFGVFTARNYSRGQRIAQQNLGIQIVDPEPFLSGEHPLDSLLTYFSWNPIVIGGDMEADNVFSILPGIGMLLNFHPVLHNVFPGSLYEDPLDSRSIPTAGSFTAYHNLSYIVTADISAGQELFISVYEEWFNQKSFSSVPSQGDFQKADKLIRDLVNFRKSNPLIHEATMQQILYRIKTEMQSGVSSQKLLSLIPDSWSELQDAFQRGSARATLLEVGMEELQKTGKCLDNIRPGISTIPGAGRGAFATRFIKKGSLVSPAPLVHIRDHSVLGIADQGRNVNSKQLLLNYCFGHRKSSILLCPTTLVTLINHSSKVPNVEIRWAKASANVKDTKHYLRGKLDEFLNEPLSDINTKLMFDFVALNDIKPGEEILLDYGNEWEVAFGEHTVNWKESLGDHESVPIDDQPQLIIPSNDNQNHTYVCRLEPFPREDEPQDMEDIPVQDYFANPSVDSSTWSDELKLIYLDNQYAFWWPCEVITSNVDNSVFSVNVQKRFSSEKQSTIIRKIKNVPRWAIRRINKPYRSNQHLANAFRHYIPIPDAIFPSHWRHDFISSESLKIGVKDFGNPMLDEDLLSRHMKMVEAASCGLYVAPSTIPGAGNGMFLGVDLPSSGFDIGPLAPAIPIIDPVGHSWDAADYVWEATAIDGEYEGHNVQFIRVNEGALSNFHPGLVNAIMKKSGYVPSLDHNDPGAGAFSYYNANGFESLHSLQAGDEIFVPYGEDWFMGREHLGVVPLSKDYKEANNIVSSLAALVSDPSSNLNDKQVASLMTIVQNDVVSDPGTQLLFSKIKTVEDIKRVVSNNGTAETLVKSRSLDWLQKYGKCLDHIYTKQSTIPSAGIGAFARRMISKGSVIIASPLVVTDDASVFHISGNAHGTDGDIIQTNKFQLLYNYQFYHPNSSAYFFPINTAIAINHQSSRYDDKYNSFSPNAELQWSKSERKSSYYLQRHLVDLKRELYSTVVIEFVATRDIQKDEEVFIDYGEEWEAEWRSHVQRIASNFDSNEENLHYSSRAVYLMNEDKFNTEYHRWSNSHFSVCHRSQLPTDEGSAIVVSSSSSFQGIDYNDEGFEMSAHYTPHGINNWFPCKILRADEKDFTFDVVFFQSNVDIHHVLRRLKDLKGEHLKFISKPYKGDNHQRVAFRHPIKIPDDVFPQIWMDLSLQ